MAPGVWLQSIKGFTTWFVLLQDELEYKKMQLENTQVNPSTYLEAVTQRWSFRYGS